MININQINDNDGLGIIEMPSFKLKNGVTEQAFLLAHEKFRNEFLLKQMGYLSHKLLFDNEKYFDLVIWETLEDARNAFGTVNESPAAIELMNLIDETYTDDKIPLFSIVKNY
jgi:heme-degrading monooxygenase HmoA